MMSAGAFLCVAAGGAIGSVMRYLVSLIPFKGDFPFATLIVNLLGAVIIGFIAGLAQSIGRNMTLFLKTGLCGGFTTFSTFSLEGVTLFENGKTALGCLYIVISLAGCLLGILAGQALSANLNK